jgi:hypothetical protein
MTAEYCMLILVLLVALILICITCQFIEVFWPTTRLFTVVRPIAFVAAMILFPIVMKFLFFMFDVDFFIELINLRGLWDLIVEVIKIWLPW